MQIEQLTHIDDAAAKAFENLIPQLTPEGTSPSKRKLEEILQSDNSLVFVASEDEQVVGTLTLVIYHIPSGKRAWIEDVVVDRASRGKGIGEALVRHALQEAQARGVEKIGLTSHPSRLAANRLYQKLGFNIRETNLYRYTRRAVAVARRTGTMSIESLGMSVQPHQINYQTGLTNPPKPQNRLESCLLTKCPFSSSDTAVR